MKLIALKILFSLFFAVTASSNVPETCEDSMPRRWFGPGCNYRCQCPYYDLCDLTLGTCGASGCKPGYAGPACQYVNAAFNGTIEPKTFPAFGHEAGLQMQVDGQLKSCFLEDGASGNPLFVVPRVVHWIDVITVLLANDTRTNDELAKAKDLQLTYYDVANVSTRLGSPEVDLSGLLLTYRLQTPALLTRVQVQASKAVRLYICEISMLTGRDVAVKKKASGPGPNAGSAVDGNDTTCYNRSQDAAGSPYWTVTLGQDVLVWRLRIITYGEAKVTNVRINVTQHNGTVREIQATAVGGEFLQLKTVEIVDNITIWNTSALVALCSVEVFGDCQDGKYGWQCEENCTCAGSCDKVLGGCSTAQCQTGFTGDNCKDKCPEGHYGDGCLEPCPKNCLTQACNHVTGVCLQGCKGNWTGSLCTECTKGYYGANCSLLCSSDCVDSDCQNEADQCRLGCRPGGLCSAKAESAAVNLRAASVYILVTSLIAVCLYEKDV